MCWVGDSTVAIWGYGEESSWAIPAVQIMDLRLGRRTHWFPGPNYRRAVGGSKSILASSLFFDQYLFSVHDEQGTAVWDIATGERLLHDSSLVPIGYHPRSREFLSMSSTGIRLSRLTG